MKLKNLFTGKEIESWVDKKIDLCETTKDLQDLMELDSLLNREIYIDNITPTIAEQVDKYIRFWNRIDDLNGITHSQRTPIKLYINSLGGTLSAAFTIIDAMKVSKADVYTINTGSIQKEAFYVYLMGLKRYAYPRSSFYFEKEMPYFDASDTQSNYQSFVEQQQMELKDIILQNTKITENEYEKRKGWWLTADKAFTLHICNEIIRYNYVK